MNFNNKHEQDDYYYLFDTLTPFNSVYKTPISTITPVKSLTNVYEMAFERSSSYLKKKKTII